MVKYYTVVKLFVPFLVFQVCFIIYMNFVFDYRQQDEYKPAFWTLTVLLTGFSIYFLLNEAHQLIKDGI